MKALKDHYKSKVHKKRWDNKVTCISLVTFLKNSDKIVRSTVFLFYWMWFCLKWVFTSFTTQAETAQRGTLHSGRGRESSRHGLLHTSKDCWSEDHAHRRGHGLIWTKNYEFFKIVMKQCCSWPPSLPALAADAFFNACLFARHLFHSVCDVVGTKVRKALLYTSVILLRVVSCTCVNKYTVSDSWVRLCLSYLMWRPQCNYNVFQSRACWEIK